MIGGSQVREESFYRKLTHVWFGLIFFNIALNLIPFFEVMNDDDVSIQQPTSICAAAAIRAGTNPEDCGTESVSAAPATGTSSSSSSAKKYACDKPSLTATPLGLFSVMGFSPFANPFANLGDRDPCSDRGPPRLS